MLTEFSQKVFCLYLVNFVYILKTCILSSVNTFIVNDTVQLTLLKN